MPIPRAKLQELQQPMNDRILAFLSQQPEQAFTAIEIYAAIEGLNKDVVEIAMLFGNGKGPLEQVKIALKELASNGRLEIARYQGDEYYALRAA